VSNVIPFKRPVSADRADGVFAAVNIAARNMGYSDRLALWAAREAKRQYKNGKDSAAAVVSQTREALRMHAPVEAA
jgi:hypothetical protein